MKRFPAFLLLALIVAFAMSLLAAGSRPGQGLQHASGVVGSAKDSAITPGRAVRYGVSQLTGTSFVNPASSIDENFIEVAPASFDRFTTAGERAVFENASANIGAVFEPQIFGGGSNASYPLRDYYVRTATEAAFLSAYNRAHNAGGGRVHLPPGRITLTAPVTAYSNVRVLGYEPTKNYTGNVPDQDFSFTSGSGQKGTVFVGDGTFAAFRANYTAKGSPDSPFAGNAIDGFELANLGFDNFTSAVDIGDTNDIGLTYSTLRDLTIRNTTDFGIRLTNYMRCEFRRIQTLACAHGQLYHQAVASATLQPGNSSFYDIYDNITGGDLASAAARRLHRGIVFSAAGGANNNQNRVYALQVNAAGKAKGSYTAASGGTAQFTLAAGKGAEFAVGMPVKFTNAGGNGNITTGVTYYVYSVSTDTIAVAATRYGAAITGSFSSSTAIETYGFPRIEVVAGTPGTGGSAGTTGTVTNSCFYGIEAENVTQSSIELENAAGCIFGITELVSATAGEQHIVLRTSQTTNVITCTKPFTTDIDASSIQNVIIGTRDTTNSVGYSAQWFGRNSGASRFQIGIGSSNLATRAASIEQREPSGGQFLYPLASMGVRVHGNYGAGDGTTINAGQAGVLRCTASGSGAITWNLPTIDSHTVGLVFYIQNARSGILNMTSNGTQYINLISAKNTVALAAVSGSVVAGATFIACDDGSGSNFYWRVIVDGWGGVTIP